MKFTKKNALFGIACAAILACGAGIAALNAPVVASATTHTEETFMVDGASVRYNAPTGIRFSAYVKDDYFQAEGVLKQNVTVGMTISVNGEEKDFSTAEKGESWQWATSDVDGYYKYHVVIGGKQGADFPTDQYATELTAQAYVTENDNTVPSLETVTRSIAQVANAALAENKLLTYIKSDKVLSEDKVTALDAYTAAKEAISMDNHITLEGETVTWKPVANAKGYFVRYGEKILNVVDDVR